MRKANDSIRFDSIVSIAVRWTFPALFCNPIYGSVRGKYSAASSANNAISGRDSSLWEKTNKPRSNSLSWITLFDPFRLFFDQTSPSVYPFSTLFTLSLSLCPIVENRIELLSVDGQFSVGESSHKRYKEFRIRFFRNCRFGKCSPRYLDGRSFGRLQFKMIKNMINLSTSWIIYSYYILTFET